jgi:predicted small lipoprotein YifL
MRRIAVAAVLLVLAGCGVDGPPEPPAPQAGSGLTVSGDVRTGITGGTR